MVFKLELAIKAPFLDPSGIIRQQEKIVPLSDYLYPIPIEKQINKRDNELKIDIPLSGVNVEGWMNLNPEFLALKLSFGDEPQEKQALIRCRLSKEMDVGGFKPKPKPKPSPQEFKDEFIVKDNKKIIID